MPDTKAESQIRPLIPAIVDAWNAHDAGALAGLFHEDADFVNPLGMAVHGRNAIERFHAPLFASMFQHTAMSLDPIGVRFIRDDVAIVDLAWHMMGAHDRDNRPWPDRHGVMTLVVTPDRQAWLIGAMRITEFLAR